VTFVRLCVSEVLLMSVALAAGVALSDAEPAVDEAEPSLTTAQAFLGRDLPPALDVRQWVTSFRLDPIWALVCLVALVGYVGAIIGLRRRDLCWPPARSIAWVIGCIALLWTTNGAGRVYGDVLFSMHIVQHLTIASIIPVLFVIADPKSLVLQVLQTRDDGSYGPREWLSAASASRFARLLGHPVAVATLFLGGLIVFYSSPLFESSLRSHTAHMLMVLYFLATGILFASSIFGTSPHPHQRDTWRYALLGLAFGAYAYLFWYLDTNEGLADSWFAALDRSWGASLVRDQRNGVALGMILGALSLMTMSLSLIPSADAARRPRKAESGTAPPWTLKGGDKTTSEADTT